jgi:hypothetical protein
LNFEQLEEYRGSLQIEVQLASRQLSTANLATLALSQSGPGEHDMSTKQNTRAVQKVFHIKLKSPTKNKILIPCTSHNYCQTSLFTLMRELIYLFIYLFLCSFRLFRTPHQCYCTRAWQQPEAYPTTLAIGK